MRICNYLHEGELEVDAPEAVGPDPSKAPLPNLVPDGPRQHAP